MAACNSHKCHCPDCEAEKREQTQNLRLTSVEARVGTLEHAVHQGIERKYDRPYDRHPDRATVVAGSRVIHRGPKGSTYQGYLRDNIIVWRWKSDPIRGEGWWRKWDVAARASFGAPWRYRHSFMPPLPGKQDDFFSTPPARFASGGIVPRRTVRFEGNPEPTESWVRDCFFRGTFHDAKIEPGYSIAGSVASKFEYNKDLSMTPIMLEIMLHALYCCEIFPRWHAPAYGQGVRKLISLGLIEHTTDRESGANPGWRIKATEKGRVFVDALCKTPLPVQSAPEWRMPS